MQTVRALFTCTDHVTHRTAHGTQTDVKLMPINEGPFWEATPCGNLEMTITNKGAADFFEPGKDYFLDFSVCEEKPAAA